MHISEVLELIYSSQHCNKFELNKEYIEYIDETTKENKVECRESILSNGSLLDRATMTISKGREIVVTPKLLSSLTEGITLIYYDVFSGEYTRSNPLSLQLVWARIIGSVASNSGTVKSRPIPVKPVVSKSSKRYKELMRELFGIKGDINKYSFHNTATIERNVYMTGKNVIDLMEEAIPLPTPTVKMNDEELAHYNGVVKFIAYVLVNNDDPLCVDIIDLGMLIEDNSITIEELEPLFHKRSIPNLNASSYLVKKPVKIDKEEIRQSAARVKILAEACGKDIKLVPKVYCVSDKPWNEFTDEEVIEYLKDNSFSEIKFLQDGGVACIRSNYKGFSLYIGVDNNTDFIRHPAYSFKTLNSAVKAMNSLKTVHDKPSTGSLIVIDF